MIAQQSLIIGSFIADMLFHDFPTVSRFSDIFDVSQEVSENREPPVHNSYSRLFYDWKLPRYV